MPDTGFSASLQEAESELDIASDHLREMQTLLATAEGLRDLALAQLDRAKQRVLELVSGNR